MGCDATVVDFWRFAMSDLRTNNVRGYLAEFLVARAVGTLGPRVEWYAFEVLTSEGTARVRATAFARPFANAPQTAGGSSRSSCWRPSCPSPGRGWDCLGVRATLGASEIPGQR